MLTPGLRWLLIGVLAVTSVVRAGDSPLSSALYGVAAVLLAVGHFLHGSIWLVLRALRRGDTERAERLLSGVKRPQHLSPESRAYWEFAHGMLGMSAGRWQQARQHLLAALSGQLRTSNDRALVACQLAAVELELGDREAAMQHVARAEAEGHRSDLTDLIERVKQRLREQADSRTDSTPSASTE